MNGSAIKVLDKGWVLLRDSMGTDMDIVQTARESTTANLKGTEEDKRLLDYLYRNGHVSPFAYPQISFRMYLPIFVQRQFIRHWSLKFNEMSGRYTVLPEDVHIPGVWRKQDNKNKQGSNLDMPFTDEENQHISALFSEQVKMNRMLENQMLENDIAREMARMNQTLAQYTRVSVVGSLRDWLFGFLRQRLDPHAQEEIRVYAYAVAHFLKELYPNTMQLFYKYTLGDMQFILDDFQGQSLSMLSTMDLRKKIETKKEERDLIWKNVCEQKVKPFEVIEREIRSSNE